MLALGQVIITFKLISTLVSNDVNYLRFATWGFSLQ